MIWEMLLRYHGQETYSWNIKMGYWRLFRLVIYLCACIYSTSGRSKGRRCNLGTWDGADLATSFTMCESIAFLKDISSLHTSFAIRDML